MKNYIVKLWSTQPNGGSYYWKLYAYDCIGGAYLPVGGKFSSPMDAMDRVQVWLLDEMNHVGKRAIRDGEVWLYQKPLSPEGSYDAAIEIICNPGIPEGGRKWTKQKIS